MYEISVLYVEVQRENHSTTSSTIQLRVVLFLRMVGLFFLW